MKETYVIEYWDEDPKFYLEKEGDELSLAVSTFHTEGMEEIEIDQEIKLTEDQVIKIISVMSNWLVQKRG